MIEVNYCSDNNTIVSLSLKGHAESGPYGQDLICAACSAIAFGLMNALDNLDVDVSIYQGANEIRIENDTDSIEVRNYLQLTIMQLMTIASSYPQFIQIQRKELS